MTDLRHGDSAHKAGPERVAGGARLSAVTGYPVSPDVLRAKTAGVVAC